tara:strand:+ start:19100 stop:19834 length:735 start_codon:yes stop_codon:yes gene_type:complete
MKLFTVIFASLLFPFSGIDLVNQMDGVLKPADIKSNITLLIKRKKMKTLSFRSITKDNGKKQIIWFTAPISEKGISFLKIEKTNKSEDLRMWLPAFKKTRRISSKKKGDSFMGSDLSYEDLYNRKKGEYSFKLLEHKEFKNEKCYILESIPNANLKSEYSKHITWISIDNLIPVREHSYDKNGELLKEKFFYYKKIQDYWIAELIHIENLQKNQSTRVKIENIELNSNIDDKIFHEKNLQRLPF